MNQNSLPESVIVQLASLKDIDRDLIQKCRGLHNRLGFGYQLIFVRVFNRFPNQIPFEIQSHVLTFACLQLNITLDQIKDYQNRQQTISKHQEQIRCYLQLSRFDQAAVQKVCDFLFEEAQRTEHTSILLAKIQHFLKELCILQPSQDTLKRLIVAQRQKARQFIYEKILSYLLESQRSKLDELLCVDEIRISKLQQLKQPPSHPSPKALLALTSKLTIIKNIDIKTLDITWLNNNYQRSLAKYVTRCSANRLRELQAGFRYTALICFLEQIYQDTIDHIIDMYYKLMLKVYNRAQNQLDEAVQKQRRFFKQSQSLLNTISNILLDNNISDQDLRRVIFSHVSPEELQILSLSSQEWLSGKFSNVFHLIIDKFNYLRQFAPALLAHLEFEAIGEKTNSLLKGIHLLNELNQNQRRKLPEDSPIDFIPKKLRGLVFTQGKLNRQAWECVLLTNIRDEIRAGKSNSEKQ